MYTGNHVESMQNIHHILAMYMSIRRLSIHNDVYGRLQCHHRWWNLRARQELPEDLHTDLTWPGGFSTSMLIPRV